MSDAQAKSLPDPFNPESLRLSQTSTAGLGVKKILSNIRCDRPNKQEFVRCHPGEDYRLETAILKDGADRENYLVAPALWADLAGEITPVRIVTAISRHGSVFLWPATLPAPDARSNRWHDSMLEAQSLATRRWVRVAANMSAGEYDIFEATGNLPESDWPELSFAEILRLSFKTRFIDSMDHPVLKNLRGEV